MCKYTYHRYAQKICLYTCTTLLYMHRVQCQPLSMPKSLIFKFKSVSSVGYFIQPSILLATCSASPSFTIVTPRGFSRRMVASLDRKSVV